MEGRRFVLAAGLVQSKDELFDGLERVGVNAEAKALFEASEGKQLNRDGSLIAAPDAPVIAQAGEAEEALFAELDLSEIGKGLASLDTDGHRSRPDVYDLRIDMKAKDGVNWQYQASPLRSYRLSRGLLGDTAAFVRMISKDYCFESWKTKGSSLEVPPG